MKSVAAALGAAVLSALHALIEGGKLAMFYLLVRVGLAVMGYGVSPLGNHLAWLVIAGMTVLAFFWGLLPAYGLLRHGHKPVYHVPSGR